MSTGQGNAAANLALGVTSDKADTALNTLLDKVKLVRTQLEELNRLVPQDKLTQQFNAQVQGATSAGAAMDQLANKVKNLSAEQAQALKNIQADVQTAADKSVRTADETSKRIAASFKQNLGNNFSISYKLDPSLANAAAMGPTRSLFDAAKSKADLLSIRNDWAAAEEQRRRDGRSTAQAMIIAEGERQKQVRQTGQIMVMAEVDRGTEAKRTGQTMLMAEVERRDQAKRTAQSMLMADADRAAQAKVTAQTMIMADGDRAKQSRSTAQSMIMAEGDRAKEVRQAAQSMVIAESDRRTQAVRTANEMVYAEVTRREEGKRTGQTMLMAELDRRDQARQTAQQMLMAEGDRAKAVRAVAQSMIMAEADRGTQAKRTANEMVYAEVQRRDEGKRTAVQELIAETNRREQGKQTSQEMLRAELERREAGKKTGQEMLRAEIELNEQRKIGLANARFLAASPQTRLNMAQGAMALDQQPGFTSRMVDVKYGTLATGYATTQGIEQLNRALDASKVKIKEVTEQFREAQRVLNTNFITASPAQQLSIATKASVLKDQGGDAVAKYGPVANSFANPQGLQTLAEQTKAAHAAQLALNSGMEDGKKKAQDIALAHKQHADSMRDAHSAARGLAGGLGQLWLTYGSVLPLLAGAAVATSLKEAVVGFAEVQYQMTMVKALAEDTKNSVGGLTDSMHTQAIALGISPEVASKGLRALTQAGLETDEALKTLAPTFKLATVGELSLEAAALSATGVMNAFGKEFSSIERIGDIMAKAGAVSAASVTSITESMKYSAATAAEYGVSLERLGTMITLLGKRGITGSAAGVATNNLIAETYSPASEKAKKALDALGVSAYDKVTGLRREITDVLFDIKAKVENFTPESQGALLQALYGKKGDKAFFAITQKTRAEVEKIFGKIDGADGFVSDVFAAQLETVKGQFNLLKSTMSNAMAQIGETSEGPVLEMMSRLRRAFASDELQGALRGLTQTFGTLVNLTTSWATGGLLLLWAGLRTGPLVISAVTAALGALEAVLAGISAIMSGGVVATMLRWLSALTLTNPLVLAAVGITTLLAGAYLALRDNKQSVLDKHAAEMTASTEIIAKNEEELKQLREKISLRRAGFAEDQLADQVAIRNKTSDRDALAAKLADAQSATGKDPQTTFKKNQIPLLQKALGEANDTIDTLERQASDKMELRAIAKAKRDEEEAAAKKRRDADMKGTQVWDPKTTKDKSASDIYRAGQKDLDGQLESLRDIAKMNQEINTRANKRDEAGDFETINRNLKIGIELRKEELKTFKEKEELAARTENRRVDVSSIKNKEKKLGRDDVAANGEAEDARRAILNKMDGDILKQEAQTLRDRGQLQKAFLKEFEFETAGTIKRINADLENPEVAEGIKKNLRDYLAYLDARKKSGSTGAEFEEKKGSYDNTKSEMDAALAKVDEQGAAKGGTAGALFAIEASDAIRAKYIPALQALQAELKRVAIESNNPKLMAAANNLGRDLDKEANRAEAAWRSASRSIAKSLEDAFGRGGKAIGGMVVAATDYAATQKKIDAQLEADKKGKGHDEVIKLEQKAAQESAQAQIGAYADMAGAASSFFEKQSDGYKALHTLEMGFRAIQMALSVKDFVFKMFTTEAVTAAKVTGNTIAATSSVASAGTEIASATAVGTANATAAVANQAAKGDPYSAWIRMGAMVAAMAALGYAIHNAGSSAGDIAGDRQKTQGTGTVFGSETNKTGTDMSATQDEKDKAALEGAAKSDSLRESMSLLSDNSTDALTYSGKMLTALRGIESGIGGLTNIIYRASGLTTGKNMGVFEGTMSTASGDPILGMFGMNDSSLTKNLPIIGGIVSKLQGLWGNTSQSIADSGLQVKGTISDLMAGQGVQQYAEIEKKKTSFFGLVKDFSYSTQNQAVSPEIAQQFGRIFTDVNKALEAAGGAMGQKAGQVSAMLKGVVVDMGLISLKDLKGQELTDALNGVLSKASDQLARQALPGLDEFQKAGEGYFQTAVRVSNGVEQASQALKLLGVQAIDIQNLSDKQGDVGGSLVKESLMKKESVTNWVQALMPSMQMVFDGIGTALDWGDAAFANLLPNFQATMWTTTQSLTNVGEILSDMSGSASDLAAAYRDLVNLRSTYRSIGLSDNALTRDTISGAGSLEELKSGTESFLKGFFTDAEQNATKAKSLQLEFGALGITMPKTKDEFKALVQQLNLADPAQQRLLGGLMRLSDAFNDVADKTGTAVAAIIAQRALITSQAVDNKASTLTEEAQRWLQVRDRSREIVDTITDSIYEQKKAAYDASAGAQLTAAQEAARQQQGLALEQMRSSLQDAQQTKIAQLYTMLNQTGITPEQQLDLAEELEKAVQKRYDIEQENIQRLFDVSKSLKAYLQDLAVGDLAPSTSLQKLEAASAQYNRTLAQANGGDATAQEALQGKADNYLQLARTFYSSSESYAAIFASVTSDLDNVSSLMAATAAQKQDLQLDALNKLQAVMTTTAAQAQAKYDTVIDRLSVEIATLQALEAMYGVQSTVPDILKAMPAQIAAEIKAKSIAALVSTPTQQAAATPALPTPFYQLYFQSAPDGSHADGLGWVPFDGYRAELHRGERVLTAQENRDYAGKEQGNNAMVAEIRALRQEVAQLRQEQSAQTGAVIQAQYDATDRAAEKVVDGTIEAADNAAWKQSSAATLK